MYIRLGGDGMGGLGGDVCAAFPTPPFYWRDGGWCVYRDEESGARFLYCSFPFLGQLTTVLFFNFFFFWKFLEVEWGM